MSKKLDFDLNFFVLIKSNIDKWNSFISWIDSRNTFTKQLAYIWTSPLLYHTIFFS